MTITSPLQWLRDVSSPLTEDMLAPMDPLGTVQFSSGLTDADYATLGQWLADYPKVILRAYFGGGDPPITNLDFLRFFPNQRAFEADAYGLADIEGLGYLPDDVFHLGLGATKKRLSLAPLQRFGHLRRLTLEGHTKDIEVISGLQSLTSLTLRSVTLPDLTILTPLRQLLALDIKLGGTHNLDLLPQIGRPQYLELWQIRGLHDISAIGRLDTLQHLFLQAIRHITQLPPLHACTQLQRIHLETMKGLTDLTPLLTAPALTDLMLADMGHLHPADITVLRTHPTLQRVGLGLGSTRKNTQAAQLVPLPPTSYVHGHPTLDPRHT
ncbi:hypothetical protein [Allorhizocola rhizosphaerae]|uniref:hypothetical protein n=1 Tax=Allorhizocola rhizosphaerae TaxID=1872709 RepID=UPI000E3CE6FF|nr:hypothetical protein [Allorhizocola rhizosphaerae]